MPIWGKYRGRVADNKDPLNRGRLQVLVPAISDTPLTWAEPCTPYAGPKLGWFALPPISANVWVEFEAGDPDRPIWTGCFWGTDEATGVPPDAKTPDVKVFQTEKIAIILDNTKDAAKLTIRVETDDGTMKVEMDKSGIVLTAAEVKANVTTKKIELLQGQNSVELSDNGITLKRAPATIAVSNSIKLENGGASAELSAAAIDLKNGASSVSLSPATVSINNGALEVM